MVSACYYRDEKAFTISTSKVPRFSLLAPAEILNPTRNLVRYLGIMNQDSIIPVPVIASRFFSVQKSLLASLLSLHLTEHTLLVFETMSHEAQHVSRTIKSD
jgi:hypothetical protein